MTDARLELADNRAIGPPWPQRLGTLSVFLANGLGIGSWAASIPSIKADLALSDAGLGFALLAFAAGGIVAMPLTGLLAHRLPPPPALDVARIGVHGDIYDAAHVLVSRRFQLGGRRGRIVRRLAWGDDGNGFESPGSRSAIVLARRRRVSLPHP